MQATKIDSPLIFIVFGATGDLTRRKLMPALFQLFERGIIDKPYIIGAARREASRDEFCLDMREVVTQRFGKDPGNSKWQEFTKNMDYVSGTFEDPVFYQKITAKLNAIDADLHACIPRYFYLAANPSHYESILTNLSESKLSEGCGQGTNNFTRIILEKPFGRDLETAQNLEKKLATIFEERQIYRIDHYLGKESMQNILAFRFGNGMFEPTWNYQFIDHVQMTFAEDIGIGSRGEFYDGIGTLRDVVQNHMLQMVALMAMEQPPGFDAQSIRDSRVAAMHAIGCIAVDDVASHVVRGQYVDGRGGDFRSETGVKADSQTETFVALKLHINTPRFSGVPFYLRAGKRLQKKTSEISIHYKIPPCPEDRCLFRKDKIQSNVLKFAIEPDTGVSLSLMVKEQGFGMNLVPVTTDIVSPPSEIADPIDAYERLLLDAVMGDQTLFARTDEIVSSWQFMTNILTGWQEKKAPLFEYPIGSWGPDEANTLIQRDNRQWG